MVWRSVALVLVLAACADTALEDVPPDPMQTTTPPGPAADAEEAFRARATAWFLSSDYDEARELALMTCWLLREDATVPQVASVIGIVAEAPRLADSAGFVMRAAVASFCPDQAYRLEDAPPEAVQTTTPPSPAADAEEAFRARATHGYRRASTMKRASSRS